MNSYLAVDIGASSGRHIVSWMEDGKIRMQEIYRFDNGIKRANKDGHLCWNTERLFREILNGMKKCKEEGFIPKSMGIDTWGVDFVLLDPEDNQIGESVAYRDDRTIGIDQEIFSYISERNLYERTGIQKQNFNTIYQLMAIKKQTPELLEQSETMLMIPDYFHFLLTGKKCTEYTNATTGQLVNVLTGDWDDVLIDTLGFPKRIFQKLERPGTVLGGLKSEIQEKVGYDCQVVLPATHDTGSAVMAVPTTEEGTLYISSGTWSLMGTELKKAQCSEESQKLNFTNEGGYGNTYRFLKNIMGLWMIQSLRHEYDDKYSFAELCSMAEEEKEFPSRVDVNATCFLAPENMTEEVMKWCKESGQKVPETVGQQAAVIYQSLAECYGKTIREIESITGKTYNAIHIIGGGSNADYLNQLTAKCTGKTVIAGPGEATAIGNILAQMIKSGEFKNLKQARKCVKNSFKIKYFESGK